MNTSNEAYKKYADKRAENSPIFKDCIWAFFVGGAICTIGHGLKALYLNLNLSDDNAGMLASVTLIALAILVTGLGKFDDLAKHAGAGTLVPITGFANAVVSPSIEFKNEGFIFGVGVKMFTVAGPVIVYGVLTSVVGGILYYIFAL